MDTNIAKDFPDLLHAYIGIGQVVDVARGLEIAFQAVLSRANELVEEYQRLHELESNDHSWQKGQISTAGDKACNVIHILER